MALKDWKKSKETATRIEWKYVGRKRNVHDTHFFIHKRTLGWVSGLVDMLDPYPTSGQYHEFAFGIAKTKSQALKFAKEYMRKH